MLITKIEWPIEGQRHTKPSCSRRKDAVGLGEILDLLSNWGSLGMIYHIDPQRDANEQVWGRSITDLLFKQWFTFSETYPHGIPGFYLVSAALL